MSEVLEFVRSQDPGLKDIPDDQLNAWLADEHPELLEAAKPPAELQPVSDLQGSTLPKPKGEVLDQWAKLWGGDDSPTPAAKPAKNVEEAARTKRYGELEQWFKETLDLVGSNPEKVAKARKTYVEELQKIGITSVEDKGPVDAVGRLVGPTMARASKVTQAALADALATASGAPGGNLQSFASNPDAPLPIELQVQEADSMAGRVGLGLTGMVPVIGVAAGAGAAGAPAQLANALAMGFDAEGKPSPSGLIAAVGLPIVDKAGRAIAADLITKRLEKTKLIMEEMVENPGTYVAKRFENRLPALEKMAVQRALEIGGGQLANNAFLLAIQTPGILDAEDPTEALEEAMIMNLATSLLGAGEVFRGGKSVTYGNVEAKLDAGKLPLDVEFQHRSRPKLPPESAPEPPPAPKALPGPDPAPTPASPPEPAAAAPMPQDTSVVLGKTTRVQAANDVQIDAVYAWVPRDLINASHNKDFVPNPLYAPLKNTRKYDSDPAEQEKVLLGAQNWDPYSYTTNVKGAGEGPVLVSRGSDGIYRALGGNGRAQMIARLSPEQLDEFGKVQNEEAAVFGLPGRPTPAHLLVRLLPSADLSSPEGVEGANRVVDLLNPSSGLVESTASMARNDASKVPYPALASVQPGHAPAKLREWLGGLIGNGTIDRNTRTPILKSDATLTDYVQRVILHAAYRSDQVVEFRQNPRTNATMVGLIDAGADLGLQLRARGDNDVAASFTELVQRIADFQSQFPAMKMDELLRQVAGQSEGFETPAGLLSRNLAAVLASKVERLPANKRGERKIDAEESVKNFEEFFGSLARSVKQTERTADLFGNTRTVTEVISDFVRANLGDAAILKEPSADWVMMEPDPKVKRLNKLMAHQAKRPLTPAEHRELVELEAGLGQDFLAFHREHTAKSAEADREFERMQIAAKANAPLRAAAIEIQTDIFGAKPVDPNDPGQLTMFDRRRRVSGDEAQTLAERRRKSKPGKGQLEFEALQAAFDLGNHAGPLSSIRLEAGLEKRGSGSIQLYARTVAQELINFGGVDVRGRFARNHREAAVLFQTFRQPQFEVFHWVFTKQGKVVGRYAVTGRLPGTTWAFVSGDGPQTIIDLMRSHGADGYWALHNHPSGNPSPSGADLYVTGKMAQHVPGFLGHIIINHRRYSVIDEDGHDQGEYTLGGDVADPLRVPAADQPLGHILGRSIFGPEDLARLGITVSRERGLNLISLLYRSIRGDVRALGEVSVDDFLSPEIGDHIRSTALSQGAGQVLMYYEGTDPTVRSRAEDLVREGFLFDGVMSAALVSANMRSGLSMRDRLAKAGFRFPRESWMDLDLSNQERSIELYATRIAEEARQYQSRSVSAAPGYNVELPGGKGKKAEVVPVALGGLQHVHPVEFPEIVKLAKILKGGQVPKLKRFRTYLGLFYGDRNNPRIALHPSIFQSSAQAAMTLAHEIGHWIDFLPDGFLDRGNILGRLAVLRQFLTTTLPLDPNQPIDTTLTPQDRQRLRRKAEKQVGPRPPDDGDRAAWGAEVSAAYADLVTEEIEHRGLVKASEVHAELWELSKFWKPIDEASVPEWFLEYRKSSIEVYADAISVLFNSPALLAERAPLFYKMFWSYLDRKPDVKAHLFAIQDFIQKGKVHVLDQRRDDRHEMMGRGEEIMMQKARERELRRRSWKGYRLELEQELFDAYQPVIAKVQQAEAAGVKFSAAADPRNILEQGLMCDNANARLIKRMFEKVVQPLEAIGISVTELGDYLFLRRVMLERREIANPGGQTPETAREGLLKMRLDLGIEKMTLLEDAVAKFHDAVFQVVEQAVELGSYNRETFETKLKPNKDVYAAFAALDYLEDFVPAGIKKQVGTLGDVANPFSATVLKTIALNNLNSVQRSKNATRDLLTKYFPAEIEKAKGRFLAPGVEADPPPKADKGVLTVLENGRPAHYYVDPLIAIAFQRESPQGLHRVLRVLDTVFRKGFYRLYITYSPSFLIFNPKRDFMRTWLNMPKGVGMFRMAQAYAKTFRSAISQVRGMPDGLATEMMANYAIGTAHQTMARGHRDDHFGNLLRRYHMLPEVQQPGFFDAAIFAPVRAIGRAMEFFGSLQEVLPKTAGYHVATRHLKMAPREAAAHVRNYAGTPNIFKKGRSHSVGVVRAIFPFFNVFAQGFRSDWQRMHPKSGSGWLFKWAATDGMWAMLTALGSAGLLGGALKALLSGPSEYDKTNYNVVPVGWSPGGESGKMVHYFRIPRTESSRLLSGLTYKLTRLLAGDSPEAFTDVLDFGAGSMPSVNPAVSIPAAWTEYATGHNPNDPFRGRPIVPSTEFAAGGWDSLKPMFQWTFDKSGLGSFTRWNPHAQTTTQLTLSAIPGLNAIFKTSDYGFRESQMAVEREDDAVRARHRLAMPDNARALIGEYNFLRSIDETRRTPQQAARYQLLNVWHNSVYRTVNEDSWLMEQAGQKEAAQSLRNALKEMSEPYAK